MEKSDSPALTIDEHNNLLLRLTLVQLTSINSRLDNLETQIHELLVRTTSRSESENSNENNSTSDNMTPSNNNALPTTEESTPTETVTRTIIRYLPEGDNNDDSEAQIPVHVSCMIENRVQQMREDLLERVAQIMQQSTMKTKTVVESSLNRMTENITGIIDRNLTTMGEEVETLKRSFEELSKKSRPNPPNREADLRNTMEKLRQNLTTTSSQCQTDLEVMKEDQGRLREEIRVLREEIYQLKVRQSVEALSIEN